jgi:hypothetical protein
LQQVLYQFEAFWQFFIISTSENKISRTKENIKYTPYHIVMKNKNNNIRYR